MTVKSIYDRLYKNQNKYKTNINVYTIDKYKIKTFVYSLNNNIF